MRLLIEGELEGVTWRDWIGKREKKVKKEREKKQKEKNIRKGEKKYL